MSTFHSYRAQLAYGLRSVCLRKHDVYLSKQTFRISITTR
jgi:hypothetical protein